MSKSFKSAPASTTAAASSSTSVASPSPSPPLPGITREDIERTDRMLDLEAQAGARRAAGLGVSVLSVLLVAGLAKKAVFAVGGVGGYCGDANLIQIPNPLPNPDLPRHLQQVDDPDAVDRYLGSLTAAAMSFPADMPCDEVRMDISGRWHVVPEGQGGSVGSQLATIKDQVRGRVEAAARRARKKRATIEVEVEEAARDLVGTCLRVWVEVHAADELLREGRVRASQIMSYVGMEYPGIPHDLVFDMRDKEKPAVGHSVSRSRVSFRRTTVDSLAADLGAVGVGQPPLARLSTTMSRLSIVGAEGQGGHEPQVGSEQVE